jgi:hypothetical protein
MKYTITKSEIFAIANARKVQKLNYQHNFFENTGLKVKKCLATDGAIVRLRIVNGEISEQILDLGTVVAWAKLQPNDVTVCELIDDTNTITLTAPKSNVCLVKHTKTLPFRAGCTHKSLGEIHVESIGDPIVLQATEGNCELRLCCPPTSLPANLISKRPPTERELLIQQIIERCRKINCGPWSQHESEAMKYVRAAEDLKSLTFSEALVEARTMLKNRRFARKLLQNYTKAPEWFSDKQNNAFGQELGPYYAAKNHYRQYRPRDMYSDRAKNEESARLRKYEDARNSLQSIIKCALGEKFESAGGCFRSPNQAAYGRDLGNSWQKARLIVRNWPAKRTAIELEYVAAFNRACLKQGREPVKIPDV